MLRPPESLKYFAAADWSVCEELCCDGYTAYKGVFPWMDDVELIVCESTPKSPAIVDFFMWLAGVKRREKIHTAFFRDTKTKTQASDDVSLMKIAEDIFKLAERRVEEARL